MISFTCFPGNHCFDLNDSSKPRPILKRNGLKIALLDIVSLRKHRHELSVLLHDNGIDVIGLCEARLDNKVADSDVSIAGFKIFRNDQNLDGGGVVSYEKECFPEPSFKLKSDSLKLLVLELTPKNSKSFFLESLYRHSTPGVDIKAFENLRNDLKNLDHTEKEVILVVDTNCDFKSSRNSNALARIYTQNFSLYN